MAAKKKQGVEPQPSQGVKPRPADDDSNDPDLLDDDVLEDDDADLHVEKPDDAEYASEEDLLGDADGSRPQEDVFLPVSERWVRIQTLDRAEAIKVSNTKNLAERERKIIAWALVAPAMDYQKVEAWHKRAATGDVQVLVEAISDLSGMIEGARKKAYKRFR